MVFLFLGCKITHTNIDFGASLNFSRDIYIELSAVNPSSAKSVCFNSPAFDFRPQFSYSSSDRETHGEKSARSMASDAAWG